MPAPGGDGRRAASRGVGPRRRRPRPCRWCRRRIVSWRGVGHQAEEHVLEPLTAGPEVGQRQVSIGEPGGEGGDEASACPRPRRGTRPTPTSCTGAPRWVASSVTCRPAGAPNRTSAASVARRTSGSPAASTRPWSRMTTWSATRSASSRSWVVSTTVTPSSRSPATTSRMAWRPVRVDPGRRLVEERHLGPPDEGEGEGEPPLLAAGQLAPGPPLLARQPHPLEQAARVVRRRRRAQPRGASPRRRARPGRRRRTGASRRPVG